ncbi:MAG: zinc ribbon domain-containing protein, partial [Myxococcota bacterium]
MARCPQCGADLQGVGRFCGACGADVSAVVREAPKKEKPKTMLGMMAVQPPPGQGPAAQPPGERAPAFTPVSGAPSSMPPRTAGDPGVTQEDLSPPVAPPPADASKSTLFGMPAVAP